MADKINKNDRKMIDEFIQRAKEQGKSLTVPQGVSGMTLEQILSPGLSNPTFQKQAKLGKFLRKRISGFLDQGLSVEEVAEKMHMSRDNVMYHIRKLPPR